MTNETYNVLFSLGFMYLKHAMAVSKTKIKFKYNQGNQTVFHNLHIKDTLLDFEKKSWIMLLQDITRIYKVLRD